MGWVLVKGAPEAVLESCSFYRERGRELPLSPEKREFYLKKAEEMSDRALRVLALAYKRENRPGKNEDLLTRALVLVGLVGMQDPPRPEAPRVLEKCRRAGYRGEDDHRGPSPYGQGHSPGSGPYKAWG
ncbi:MAG TPA: cation-transporting P-type ATPase [Moorella mulderi]|nr:cation-transporting P-type ATPase [Moorella mulderi]